MKDSTDLVKTLIDNDPMSLKNQFAQLNAKENQMNENYKTKMYDIKLYLHHETHPNVENEGALKVSHDGEEDKAVWLPKSAIQFQLLGPSTVLVVASEKLLIEKELV